jgi:hypothetical protein
VQPNLHVDVDKARISIILPTGARRYHGVLCTEIRTSF